MDYAKIDFSKIDPNIPSEGLLALGAAIKHSPVAMAKTLIGSTYYPKQREIVMSPFRHMKVAWVTGNGVGKSYSVPDIIILWMLSHPPCYVIVMSSTWEAVKKKLMASLRNRLRGMKVRFFDRRELPNTESWEIADEWAVIGVSPKDVESIQGWHSKGGTLFIVDEASILDSPVLEGMESQVKSRQDCIFLIGNPIRGEGPFAEIALGNMGPSWFIGNVATWESPNYIATQKWIAEAASEAERLNRHNLAMRGEGPVAIPGLQTYLWVENMRAKHGENNPIWQARVAGQVPDQAEDIFFPRSLIQACEVPEPSYRAHGARWVLADPARSETGDKTVIKVWDNGGKRILKSEEYQGWDEYKIRTRILALYREFNADMIKTDRTGIGSPLYDNLFRAGVRIESVFWNEAARDNKAYANIRGEAAALLKYDMQAPASSRIQLSKRDVAELMEASRVKRKEDARGRLLLESKKEMRERGVPSPNHLDCLMLAYAQRPGDVIFASASGMYHRMEGEVAVYHDPVDETYMLLLKSMDRVNYGGLRNPRPGMLWRSLWYGGWQTESAALWVHVDETGTWTVFDGFKTTEGCSMEAFAKRVMQHSKEEGGRWHTYSMDLISTPTASETRIGVPLIATIHEIMCEEFEKQAQDGLLALPHYINESAIKGMAGFDYVNDLLRSTKTRFSEPEAGEDGMPELRREQIYIRPLDIAEELENARLQPRPVNLLENEDSPGKSVAGGGSYVRCLRLLAVHGAGVSA